jgi:hypothetical protein
VSRLSVSRQQRGVEVDSARERVAVFSHRGASLCASHLPCGREAGDHDWLTSDRQPEDDLELFAWMKAPMRRIRGTVVDELLLMAPEPLANHLGDVAQSTADGELSPAANEVRPPSTPAPALQIDLSTRLAASNFSARPYVR